MRRTWLLTPLALLALAGGLEGASRLAHLDRAPLLPYYFADGAAFLPSDLDLEASFYGRKPNRYVTDDGGARIADPSLAATRLRDGVFVVGDSQALGYMLDFEETFASRVAGRLLGDPRAARILASPADQPATSLAALHRYAAHGLERQRLAVVTLNLGNDLDEMYTEALDWERGDSGPVRRWLASHSFVCMDLALVRAHVLYPSPEPAGVNPILYLLRSEERVLLAREAVRVLTRLSETLDADRKLLVIIPADIQVSPREFDKYGRYYTDKAEFERWRRQVGALSAMMNALESYIAQRAAAEGLEVLRFSQLPAVVHAEEPLFDYSSQHLTAEAHGLLADAIVRAAGGA